MHENTQNMLNLLGRNPRRSLTILVLIIAAAACALGWYLNDRSRDFHVNAGPDTGLIFSVASSTGNTAFVVADNGDVGVNTLTPGTDFDVVGLARATYAFVPKCTKDIEGAFTYERTSHHFLGCDGVVWHVLDN